jgi:RNA polymerase sigma-70 factor (ECF subfamily)
LADTPQTQQHELAPEEPRSDGQPGDRELVERAQKGDGAAQEVLQEAFLNAYQKLPLFRGEAQFSSWLYRIAANSALMRLRRKRRAPDTLSDQPLELSGPRFSAEGYLEPTSSSDWSQRADEKMMSGELGNAINKAVQELPADYRTVFLLKDVDGLSNEDIANALDLTVPAVKSRLHRARLALREKLGEFFDSPPR